jgi:hypothetical protein
MLLAFVVIQVNFLVLQFQPRTSQDDLQTRIAQKQTFEDHASTNLLQVLVVTASRILAIQSRGAFSALIQMVVV